MVGRDGTRGIRRGHHRPGRWLERIGCPPAHAPGRFFQIQSTRLLEISMCSSSSLLLATYCPYVHTRSYRTPGLSYKSQGDKAIANANANANANAGATISSSTQLSMASFQQQQQQQQQQNNYAWAWPVLGLSGTFCTNRILNDDEQLPGGGKN